MKPVFEFLQEHAIPHRVIEHVAVFRVGEEPPELEGVFSTKNLLLKDTKSSQVYLVMMEGEKKLDIAKLASAIETTKSRLRFLRYEEVEPAVGVQPGSVSILNLTNSQAKGIKVLFDTALLAQAEIGSHPNVNTATVLMTPANTLKTLAILGAEVVEVAL